MARGRKRVAAHDTRNQEGLLIGPALPELKENSLPTGKQIMGYFNYLKNQFYYNEAKQLSSENRQDIWKKIAKRIHYIWWDIWSIPVFDINYITTLLTDKKYKCSLEPKFQEISKNQHRPNKLNEIEAILDNCFFQIQKCKCYHSAKSIEEIRKMYKKKICNCPPESQIPDREFDFFSRELFDRDNVQVFGIDKKANQEWQEEQEIMEESILHSAKKSKKMKQEEERIEKWQKEKDEQFLCVQLEESFEAQEDPMPKVENKQPILLDRYVSAAIRYGVSQKATYFLLNCVMLDIHAAIDQGFSLTDLWLSRSTIQNKIKETYAMKVQAHSEKHQKLRLLGFDEKEDETLTSDGIIKEKHLTITSGDEYIGFNALDKKDAETMSDALVAKIEETDSADSVTLVQADNTASNRYGFT